MLQISNLHAFYDKSHVLHGVQLDVRAGEIVALLGRNGSGRSTVAKAIMGQVQWQGQMLWNGQDLQGMKTFQIAQSGIGYVPESRDVFPNLTVHQNLMLGEKNKKRSGKSARWSFDDMYAMFPQLRARRDVEAGLLSGGEQQMLTLCRTLMGDPELIIIDEPTEGLAPMIVDQLADIFHLVADQGTALLLIEQNMSLVARVAHRYVAMAKGAVVAQGAVRNTPQGLRDLEEHVMV